MCAGTRTCGQPEAEALIPCYSELMRASYVRPLTDADTEVDAIIERFVDLGASHVRLTVGSEAQSLEAMRGQHAAIWPLVHAARYAELASVLGPLIKWLEAAIGNEASDAQLQELRGMLVDAYQVASAMMAKIGEADTSWIAADRAVAVAESLGDPLALAASLLRMAHAFLVVGMVDQASYIARGAGDALVSRVESDREPEAMSLYGALQLVMATASARESQRDEAYRHLDCAREMAGRLGADRNDYDTEFGPTNVDIHTVAVAIELGDADYAIQLSSALKVEGLSPERRARYLIDLAVAYAARQDVVESLGCLEAAELLTPEQIPVHRVARSVVRDLLRRSGAEPQSRLRELAERCGVF